jgi:hypothetical protein
MDCTMKPNQIRNRELRDGNNINYLQSWRTLKKIESQVFDDNQSAACELAANKPATTEFTTLESGAAELASTPNIVSSTATTRAKRKRDWRIPTGPTLEEQQEEDAHTAWLVDFLNKNGRLPISVDEDPRMAGLEGFMPGLRMQQQQYSRACKKVQVSN